MLSPAETIRKDARLALGRVAALEEGFLTLAVPGTDYRLRLALRAPLQAPIGAKVRGAIQARARRVDKAPSGGCYIEPVIGRPRRVQGRVAQTLPERNALLVQAGVPVELQLTESQRAEDFQPGQIVTTDVEPGALFVPSDEPTTPGHAP